jgi:hypothetical protein
MATAAAGADLETFWMDGMCVDGLGWDTQPNERLAGVGRELDAGADLGQLGASFQHDAAEADLCQRQRRGQPTDPAAGDDDRAWRAHVQAADAASV